jgi:hypothetical protein
MKVTSILVALFTIFVVLCSYNGGRMATTSSNPKAEPKGSRQMTSPGGPVSWAPFRDSFTVIEEEAFLIGISVDCPSKTPTGNEFELLPPTPSFVSLSPACVATAEARALAILQVNAQAGSAGKYQIKLRATPCYGSLGSELTFKLKVKKR